MTWYLVPLILALGGCSLQKMALRQSTPVFEKSSDGMMKEGDWEFFKAATPSNLKSMELIWMQDPENLKLLSVLTRSYAAYAFVVHETLAFEADLAGVDDFAAKNDAITFYTRTLDFGLLYLDKKGIKRKDLLENDDQKLIQKLNKLDVDDANALLYTAQAWGSLINLQKDNIALVSQIPKVKVLFDHVCKIEPDIDQNVCDIFFAQYEASRPKMLGGNPENAEKMYLQAIKKYPHNLLIRTNYIQYLLLPGFESEKYEKQAVVLKEKLMKWNDLNRDTLENLSPFKKLQDLNLYNSVAKKRFQIIEKYKSKIF